MNSIFQQLYMIPIWRKTILEIQPKDFFPDEENILKPFKVLYREKTYKQIFFYILGYFFCSLLI